MNDFIDKYLVFFCTRNNYGMVGKWLENNYVEGMKVLNLDVGSSQDNLERGRALCEESGVHFKVSDSSAMSACLVEAAAVADSLGLEWVFYCHHDIYPMSDNAYNEVGRLTTHLDPNDSGLIGFNICHDKADIDVWDKNKPKLMTSARTILQLGDGWYRNFSTCRVNYSEFKQGQPFFVESVMWVAVLASVSSIKTYVDIDEDFQFFLAFDDVIFQYLAKGRKHLVFPDITFAHDQSIKVGENLPVKSPIGSKSFVRENYGRLDYFAKWEEKWGFPFNFRKSTFSSNMLLNKTCNRIMRAGAGSMLSGMQTFARRGFTQSIDDGRQYSSVINSFYNHDPKTGPIEYL